MEKQTSNHSSALIVEIDHAATPPTASVIQRIIRPDEGLSRSRGNHQRLPNGNAFVCWSDNAYFTEHDPEGQLVMEARFISHRLTTYRAYKSDFVGNPTEKPAVKAFAYGTTLERSTLVVYVSWNGATEVAVWRFHSVIDGESVVIGEMNRTGFETMFQADGYYPNVYAEALAADGSSLGNSESETVIQPQDWAMNGSPHRPDSSKPESSPHSVQDAVQEEISRPQQLQTLLNELSTRPSSFVVLGVAAASVGVLYSCGRILLGGRSLRQVRRGLKGTLSRSSSPIPS